MILRLRRDIVIPTHIHLKKTKASGLQSPDAIEKNLAFCQTVFRANKSESAPLYFFSTGSLPEWVFAFLSSLIIEPVSSFFSYMTRFGDR
jgi:hypothetical protein